MLLNKKKQILEQQVNQQRAGISSTGKPFININTGTDEYSPGYAKKKGKLKPIDLFNTGSFQREEFMDVRKDVIVFDSADKKTEKLIEQFGEEIFGLSPDTRIGLKPELQTELKNVVNSEIKRL